MSKDKVATCYKATAADTMNVRDCRLVALNPEAGAAMTAVGFEPTQISLVELESTLSDHSGKLSLRQEIVHTWPGLNWPSAKTYQTV